jgi:hypothetical protein
MKLTKRFVFVPLASSLLLTPLFLTSCGSSSSGTSTSTSTSTSTASTVTNTHPILVDGFPFINGVFTGAPNALYTAVQICLPGTTTCQNIVNVQVDTGSSGLRILSSALSLALPLKTDPNGRIYNECARYSDGSTQWGPVESADIRLEGEVASSVPVQIIGVGNVPAGCTGNSASERLAIAPGANGVLGIGMFRQDCGAACVNSTTAIPATYFTCPTANSGTGCTASTIALTNQLQNPVWMFPQDNTGIVITLPAINDNGVAQVNGSLYFGIGSQADNVLGAAQIQVPDANGHISTQFNSVIYPNSFFATGARANYFPASAVAGLTACPTSGPAAGFYCPASTITNLSGLNKDSTGVGATIGFNVANAATLFQFSFGANRAFNNLAGPNPNASSNPNAFVWGLPFFLGRTMFIAIEGQAAITSALTVSPSVTKTGPWIAY